MTDSSEKAVIPSNEQLHELLEWVAYPGAYTGRPSQEYMAGVARALLSRGSHETCERCKEHEKFRHQHRDCDKLAIALHTIIRDGDCTAPEEMKRIARQAIGYPNAPKAFESQLPASRVTIPMPAVKAPRVIEPPLACDSFERDPHSVFCNKCGYPSREHGKSEGDQRG